MVTAAKPTQTERDARIARELRQRQIDTKREQTQPKQTQKKRGILLPGESRRRQFYAERMPKPDQDTKGFESGNIVKSTQTPLEKIGAGAGGGETDTLEDVEEQKQAARKMSIFRRVTQARKIGEIGELTLHNVQSMENTMKHLKNIYRVINGTSAATIWGLILTFIIMNCQLFLGNGLRMPFIPKLDKFEIVVLGMVDFILLMAAIVQTFIIVMYATIVYYITEAPIEGLKAAFAEGGVFYSLFQLVKESISQ